MILVNSLRVRTHPINKYFTSSSENGNKKTFIVNKPIDKKTYAISTRNKHVDPKGKDKMDDEGFTRVKDTRGSSRRLSYAGPRRPMRNNFNNDWYVPQFHGYYNKCNTYGHIIAQCRLMCRSIPSYESRNPFSTLWDVNFICYHCNGYGHRSHDCRKNVSQSYNRFLNTSFIVIVKCYHCQNLGHIVKHCKLRTIKKTKIVSTMESKTKSDQNEIIEKKEVVIILMANIHQLAILKKLKIKIWLIFQVLR